MTDMARPERIGRRGSMRAETSSLPPIESIAEGVATACAFFAARTGPAEAVREIVRSCLRSFRRQEAHHLGGKIGGLLDDGDVAGIEHGEGGARNAGADVFAGRERRR